MSKIVFVGFEDSGKSLMMQREMVRRIYRNAAWYKKTGNQRPITTVQKPTQPLLKLCSDLNVIHQRVKDLEDFEKLRGTDLFIDEIGVPFDSRTYADLPRSIRRWIAQASKLGVDIVGTAQNFMQIDVSYRRLVNRVYLCSKIAGSSRPHPTIPTSKHPWAFFGVIEHYNIVDLSTGETKLEASGFIFKTSYTFLKKSDLKFYDTNEEIEESTPPPLKKITRHWYDENGKIGHTITKYI